jgi:diamine N-acetyltransferase
METYIRLCLDADIDSLQRIGYQTYDETFRPMNAAATMDRYLAEAFDRSKLLTELGNSDCKFFLLYADGDLAGYLKVNTAPSQSDINDVESLEIERIYVKAHYKGRGLGKHLIDFAAKLAAEMGKNYLWLGVWEKNLSAITFYRKMGFAEWRRHSFRMGDELQSDLVMRRPVPAHLIGMPECMQDWP